MNPDVVVVGAGPAGMSAALALDECGASVRVVDEQTASGGQVYRAVDKVTMQRPKSLNLYGGDYARGSEVSRRFNESNAVFSTSTSVWELSSNDGRLQIGVANHESAEILHPRHVIIASGAMERTVPFPGWTLPGVMTIGAAQTLFKESALVPDGQLVLAGTGPLLYLFTIQLLSAGCKPAMILDTASRNVPVQHWLDLLQAMVADSAPLLKGLSWMRQIRRTGIRHEFGLAKLSAQGNDGLESIRFTCNAVSSSLEIDQLLVHDGVIPNTHLAMAAGCEHHWNSIQYYWAPILDENSQSSVPEIFITGDASTINGADAAQWSGGYTGYQVAYRLGLIDATSLQKKTDEIKSKLNKIRRVRKFIDNYYRPLPYFQAPPEDDTIVCRCEEVDAGEIRRVATMGAMGPNQAKAFTRCGMGPCMGRLCGNTVSQIFADETGRNMSDIGHYKIRPPVRPLTIGQLIDMKFKE